MTKDLETAQNDKQELVHVDEVNRIDDANIISMMTGKAMDDYVYRFNQGGRTIEGLTLAGINEAANRRGGIQVENIEYQELEKSWICTAKAVDTIDGNSRFGAYEQPKLNGSRPDPFAFTKAIHKAQRNAIKQLIPTPIIREVINFYLGEGEKTNTQQYGKSNVPAGTNFQKASFASAGDLQNRLDGKGISKENLWDYVKKQFNVTSRTEMNEEQWATLSAELRAAKTTPSLFEALCKRIESTLNIVSEDENDIEMAKGEVAKVWTSLEETINPLTKKDCFNAGVQTYGDSQAWDSLMWKQFANDIINFETNYLGELRSSIIKGAEEVQAEPDTDPEEESEQDILDNLESTNENE